METIQSGGQPNRPSRPPSPARLASPASPLGLLQVAQILVGHVLAPPLVHLFRRHPLVVQHSCKERRRHSRRVMGGSQGTERRPSSPGPGFPTRLPGSPPTYNWLPSGPAAPLHGGGSPSLPRADGATRPGREGRQGGRPEEPDPREWHPRAAAGRRGAGAGRSSGAPGLQQRLRPSWARKGGSGEAAETPAPRAPPSKPPAARPAPPAPACPRGLTAVVRPGYARPVAFLRSSHGRGAAAVLWRARSGGSATQRGPSEGEGRKTKGKQRGGSARGCWRREGAAAAGTSGTEARLGSPAEPLPRRARPASAGKPTALSSRGETGAPPEAPPEPRWAAWRRLRGHSESVACWITKTWPCRFVLLVILKINSYFKSLSH